MTILWTFLACGLASYLLGSVPFGFVVARMRGVDIRSVGSGNIGATNVFRCVGKGWGILTFAADALKGFAPTYLLPRLASLWLQEAAPPYLAVLCALAAVAGHNWPIFLGFRGGKGVATSLGVLLGMAWLAALIGFGAWLLVFLTTRYVSVASMLAAVAVAASAWCIELSRLNRNLVLPVALTLLAGISIWRHKSNIGRLLSGTEHRFAFRKTRRETD